MYDFKFTPETYFEKGSNSALIAKLNYPESQWGEQISIYAHFLDRKIEFEAVDFYGNDYLLYPRTAEEPLSFEDMVYLIEGMQLNMDEVSGSADLTLNGVPEVQSDHYSELKKFFDEKRSSFDLP